MAKTRGKRNLRNKRTRRYTSLKDFQQEITLKFLYMLNTIKLYHWKTRNYATHKATDSLYSKLGESTDKFIEILLGKTETRTNLLGKKTMKLKDIKSHEEFKKEIEKYASYLVDLENNPGMKTMTNSDLYSIRDEILGDLNQFLYLFTMK
jgi:hypothetical protein